jgi:uncharacterized membrane protein
LGWASGSGWSESYGIMNKSAESLTISQIILLNLPTIAGLLYFPLAHWCRTRALFIIAIVVSLFSCLPLWSEARYLANSAMASYGLGFGLLTLPIAFLWSYPLMGAPTVATKFQAIARNFSIVALGFILYISGFRYSFLAPSSEVFSTNPPPLSTMWMVMIPGMIILALATAKQWIQLLHNQRSRSLNVVLLAMLSVLGGYSILARITDRPELLFVFNVMLVVLSIGCIRESLETKRRSQFWYGLLVLVVLIASRFLEYDTELILKAAILTLCGFGIIAAGIWFEKYAGRSRTTLPSDSSGDLNP